MKMFDIQKGKLNTIVFCTRIKSQMGGRLYKRVGNNQSMYCHKVFSHFYVVVVGVRLIKGNSSSTVIHTYVYVHSHRIFMVAGGDYLEFLI